MCMQREHPNCTTFCNQTQGKLGHCRALHVREALRRSEEMRTRNIAWSASGNASCGFSSVEEMRLFYLFSAVHGASRQPGPKPKGILGLQWRHSVQKTSDWPWHEVKAHRRSGMDQLAYLQAPATQPNPREFGALPRAARARGAAPVRKCLRQSTPQS
jgi:hypothetical protein